MKKIFLIFALLVLAGFYFVLNKMNSLENDFKNLSASLQIGNEAAWDAIEATSTGETVKIGEIKGGVSIPTALIFEVNSSPILEPQTKITVTLENVRKSEDGLFTLELKVFTNEASAYSALEPRDLFEIVDLQGGQNQRAVKVEGNFGSIPPKSAASGRVTFKIEPTANKLILQINAAAGQKFYEVDFTKRTFKETSIG